MGATYGKEIIVGTALTGLIVGCAACMSELWAQPDEAVVHITARRFNYDPATVTLKKGVPVTLELTTADVVMGFKLPDFNVRADIVPGRTTQLRLVPDKTGTFVFLCDVFCGAGHEEMNGTLVVE